MLAGSGGARRLASGLIPPKPLLMLKLLVVVLRVLRLPLHVLPLVPLRLRLLLLLRRRLLVMLLRRRQATAVVVRIPAAAVADAGGVPRPLIHRSKEPRTLSGIEQNGCAKRRELRLSDRSGRML